MVGREDVHVPCEKVYSNKISILAVNFIFYFNFNIIFSLFYDFMGSVELPQI